MANMTPVEMAEFEAIDPCAIITEFYRVQYNILKHIEKDIKVFIELAMIDTYSVDRYQGAKKDLLDVLDNLITLRGYKHIRECDDFYKIHKLGNRVDILLNRLERHRRI